MGCRGTPFKLPRPSPVRDQTAPGDIFEAAAATFLTRCLMPGKGARKMGQSRGEADAAPFRTRGIARLDRACLPRTQASSRGSDPSLRPAPEIAGSRVASRLGKGLGLVPQGLLEGWRRRGSFKPLAQGGEPSDLDRRHSPRSSHRHLNQRLRPSPSRLPGEEPGGRPSRSNACERSAAILTTLWFSGR